MNASVLWDIVSRAFYLARDATPIGHERSLSNRLRAWSHPRRISFLRADCIFAF